MIKIFSVLKSPDSFKLVYSSCVSCLVGNIFIDMIEKIQVSKRLIIRLSCNFFILRLRLEKQSLEDKVSHLETSLGQLETEKADMKNALKTAGWSAIQTQTLCSPQGFFHI